MADKKILSEHAHNLGQLVIVALLAFFAWLKIADRSLYIFGTIFSCYTFAFLCAFVILLIKVVNMLKKNNGKFDFFSGLITASLAIVFVCTINSVAKDVKDSSVKNVLRISDESEDGNELSVVLCEVANKNNVVDEESTYINVYRVSGGVAKKIGFIDEVYFSVSCIENEMYTYFLSADKSTITIECSYGNFGDGIIMMNPAYETGKIRYVFKLD